MKQNEKRSVDGGVVTDTDARYVSGNNVVDSRNMVIGAHAGHGGARIPHPSLTIARTIPALHPSAKCVGACSDDSLNCIIYAVYSPSNNHGIYYYDVTADKSSILVEGDFLNLSPDRYVTLKIVDRKLLYLTDGTPINGVLTGNAPRMLNIQKAFDVGKKFAYELLFEGGFADNTRYRVDFYDKDFNALAGEFDEFVVTGVAGDKRAGLELVAGWLNTLPTTYGCTASTDGKSITVEVDTVEIRMRVTSNFSATPSENAEDVLTVPDNHYIWEEAYPSIVQEVPMNSTYQQFMLAREKYQPRFSVGAFFDEVADLPLNNIQKTTLQFTWRFIYDNGERSKWGAYSNMYAPDLPSYNAINIVFSDNWLDNSAALSLIKGIEFAVRSSNLSPFRLIRKLGRGDLKVTSQDGFIFLNDVSYPVVPSDEDGEPDTQVLGLFDYVPNISATLEVVADEDGSTRLVDGGVELGMDQVMADMSFEVETWHSDTIVPHFGDYLPNARYDFGIIYAYRGGKRSTVMPVEVYQVPDYTTDGYKSPSIRCIINHLPPPGATHYYIVRKENSSVSTWKTLVCHRLATDPAGPVVEYGTLGATDDSFVARTFGDPDVTHARFRVVAPWMNADESLNTLYRFDVQGNNWFSEPKRGDRIRLVANYPLNGTWVAAAGMNDDYEVSSFSYQDIDFVDGAETWKARYMWIYVEADGVPDYSLLAEDNILMQLYTPRRASSELYYEIAGDYIKQDGYHHGGVQSQTAIQPAIVSLAGTGDSHFTRMVQDFPVPYNLPYLHNMASESAHIGVESKSQTLGKPNVVDPSSRKAYLSDTFFFSDIYAQSGTSGLSSVRALNYKKVNSSYGPIRCLKMSGNVLLVICESRLQPVYVGKNRVLDLSGGQSIGRSDQLFAIAGEIEHRCGTRHPMSVYNAFGATYFYDSLTGEWLRYNNGVVDITMYGVADYFRKAATGVGVLSPEQKWVAGGYDPRYRMPIMCIWKNNDGLSRETWGFNEVDGNEFFVGKFDFVPEIFCTVGKLLVSFKNAAPYRHGDALTMCSFYGVQYTPSVTVPINSAQPEVKEFLHLRVTCPQQKLLLPNSNSITVPPSRMAPFGMASRLTSAMISFLDGKSWASFRRDGTDTALRFSSIPNPALREATAINEGRALRGDYMLLKFQPEITSQFFAFHEVDVQFKISQPSRP